MNNNVNEYLRQAKELNAKRQNLARKMDEMKHEIAEELMTPEAKQYGQNGRLVTFAGNVGGNMTKKLVEMGEELASKNIK